METTVIISFITEIYERFNIMPSLQLHMLRVAAVGELILSAEADHSSRIDQDNVISALLLHDLGNIVKFKLTGEHADWKKIQQETIAKYGSVDHEVTEKMVDELGISDRVATLISEMGFENLLHVIDSNDRELKICLYADLKVAPHGVVSIQERFVDLRKRYKNTAHESRYDSFQEKRALLLELQIFKNSSLQPSEINDQTIAHYLEGFVPK